VESGLSFDNLQSSFRAFFSSFLAETRRSNPLEPLPSPIPGEKRKKARKKDRKKERKKKK
jgi:hypothetical protein